MGCLKVAKMFKGIAVVLTMMLLAACSADDSAEPVTQQKVDNPSAANDRLATAESRSAGVNEAKQSKEYLSNDNPFVKPGAESGSEQSEDGGVENRDEDYVTEEAAGGLALGDGESGYLEWQAPTEIAYSQAEVTITGANGEQLKRKFVPGEAIVVDEPLSEGHYMWESVVTPEIDPAVQEEMRAVRQAGDFKAEQALIAQLRSQGSLPTEAQAQENRKSGSFSVRDGVATPIQPTYVDNETKQDDPG